MNIKLMLTTLLLGSLLIGVAQAGPGRGRMMAERLAFENKAKARARMDIQQEQFESSVNLKLRESSSETSGSLTPRTIKQYAESFKDHKHNIESLGEIMESITARGNVTEASQSATARILARLMVLSKSGTLSLEPRDVLEIDRHWSVQEKDMLADVLLEAKQILEEDPQVKFPEKAFEKALENRNLLDLFRKHCK